MKIKYIAYGLILSSIFFLFNEIPNIILFIGTFSLILSFYHFKNKLTAEVFKILIGLISTIILWQKHHTFINTEFGVSIVFIMATLKLWEIETVEDIFNLLLILVLLESCVLIVSPSVLTFIISTIKIFFYFYYILKIQNISLQLLSLKRLFVLLVPALLFAFFLYFIFPRFTEGFIAFNNQTSSASVFNNSNLNISKLDFPNLSNNKVFSVYNLNVDNINSTYWKSYVLWDFYKGEWRNSAIRLRSLAPTATDLANKYKIQFENNYIDYISHLDLPSAITDSKLKIFYYVDNTFKISPPRKGNFQFEIGVLKNTPNTPNEIEIKKTSRIEINNEQINLIQKKVLGNKTFPKNFSEKLKLINSFFLNNGFEYSKNPPRYKDSIDFISNGKLGFCSHFASSYALIARIFGIPSRVVIGFLGGEINPFNKSIIIRERDSHAWVEIYNEGRWIRIDPTEFVSPERTKLSSFDFYNKIDPYISFLGFKFSNFLSSFTILNQLDYLVSYLDNYFYNLLFAFDLSEQQNLFKNKEIYFFSLGMIAFFATFYYLVRAQFFNLQNKQNKEYTRLLKKLENLGLKKEIDETALEFSIRARQTFPEHASEISDIINKYINNNYK